MTLLPPLPELQAELRPGEVLLWQARPTRSGLLPLQATLTLFGLFLLALGIAGAWGFADEPMNFGQALVFFVFAFTFLASGAAFTLALPILLLRPLSAAYGLTDARVIIAPYGGFFRSRVVSIPLARIGGIERSSRWRGTGGDLSFFRELREGGEGRYFVLVGFQGLRDVRAAEAELLRLLVPLRATAPLAAGAPDQPST